MRLAWILMPLWLIGCGGGPAMFSPSGDPLADMFEAVTFGEVIDRQRPKSLAKWQGALTIRLDGDAAPQFRATIAGHAASLANASGLSIGLAGAGEPANVVIAFGNIDELEGLIAPYLSDPGFMVPMMLSSGCVFLYSQDGTHRIYEAKIFVRTGRSATGTSACLLSDMTQILGLANDADYISPSVFNGHDILTVLTTTDELLIRTLYHPTISPGMTRRRAMRRARPLLLQADGLPVRP